MGSNKGNKAVNIALAIAKVKAQIGRVCIVAPNYETAAWGKTNQDSFINTCIVVETILSPHTLFEGLKSIEKQLGRQATEVWGPREIDIDILLFNSLVLVTPRLTIPHREMQFRNFVLRPAAAIAPKWKHPVLEKTIKQLFAQSEDKLLVKEWIG